MPNKSLAIPLLLTICQCASSPPAFPGEPPPRKEEKSVLTEPEQKGIEQALKALNLEIPDLGFPKDPARPAWTLHITRRILADPLLGPAEAERARTSIQGATPGKTLLFLGGYMVEKVGDAPPPPLTVPKDLNGWRLAFQKLAPEGGFPEEALSSLSALPVPLQHVLADMACTLPEAAEQVRQGFAGIPADGVEVIRQYGRLMTIANDTCREAYRPPDPEKAKSLLKPFKDMAPLAAVLQSAKKVDVAALTRAGALLSDLADRIVKTLEGLKKEEMEGLPAGGFSLPTRFGRIVMAGTGDDLHTEPVPFLIELGGHDVYRGPGWGAATGVAGRPLALLIDRAGDDVYATGGHASLGAAFLGAAALRDTGGKDVYRGEDLSQGAALFGAASFVDTGGADDYRAGAFCQGAASFGVAVLRDEPSREKERGLAAENDRYHGGEFAQGFARTLGAAVLNDRAGHDTYRAGARALYLPLYKKHHFSHSQGFAIGVREHGAAGGVAILFDEEGNDNYLAEVHAQGAACWYSVGILYDEKGCDRYGMTFNGQGGGVHEAVGILVDGEGDDTYTLDDGAGRGGNDKYICRACAQGVGLTNAVGILLERSGNDTYAALDGHFQGAARPRRRYGSIGLLVDLGGRDGYAAGPRGMRPGTRTDGAQWAVDTFGCGFDVAGTTKDGTSADGWLVPKPILPEKALPADYPFTRKKFRKLFTVASLWDVGVDRVPIAEARGELIAWGVKAIPFLREEMSGWGGLHIWALDSIVCGLGGRHPKEVEQLVLECLEGPKSTTRVNALRLAAKLKIQKAAPTVLSLLKSPHWRLYAIGPVGKLGLKKAVPILTAMLGETRNIDEAITTLHALGRIGEPSSLPTVLRYFSGALYPVRYAAVRAAARFGKAAVEPLTARVDSGEATWQVRAHGIQALTLMDPKCKEESLFKKAVVWLGDKDWTVRAEAVRLVASFPPSVKAQPVLQKHLAGENHPFVKGVVLEELAILRGEIPRKPNLRSGIVEYPAFEDEDDDD
ncbi:MAG: HEAT repeat domain-containing protein [Planctomycetota bacterium]|jgi:hypothetical protein